MLSITELKRYAFRRGLKISEHIRKDYAQDVILFILYTRISPKFIFRGSTCLWKLYKSPRFSEDIDLQFHKRIEFEKELVRELDLWGFNIRILEKRYTANSLFMNIMLSASNFGSTQIPIEITFREGKSEETVLYSPYPDLPDFEVLSQPLDEMLADKINAILVRNKPRDLFDAYYLVTRFNLKITCKPSLLIEKIEHLRKLWRSLEPIVMRKLPPFDDVKNTIIRACIDK